MELYYIILFVHILSAMGIAAALATEIACEARARAARTPVELRAMYELGERVGSKMKILALLLAATGLYMAHAHWSIASAWVITAIIVFVYLAATGPLVFGRRMHRAAEAAERAGAISFEVRLLLDDPILATLGRLRVALFALLVFLMTTKPNLAVTLAAVGTAIVLAVASGAVAKGETREGDDARERSKAA